VLRFSGSKVNGKGQRVNKCIFHTNIWSIAQTNDRKVFKLGIRNDLGIP